MPNMVLQAKPQEMPLFGNLVLIALMCAAMYFLMFRPQSKKRKEEDEMRKSISVGDKITTIGGVIGKVVSIREDADYVFIETGVDKNRIQIKRWAIASRDQEEPIEAKA